MVVNPLAVIYSALDLANENLYPLGMAPILDSEKILFGMVMTPDPRFYHKSELLRGAIGANGVQGVDDIMLEVELPWTGIDRSVLDKIRFINLNRTVLVAKAAVGGLLGVHNDYSEPAIFQSIIEVSQLNRNV